MPKNERIRFERILFAPDRYQESRDALFHAAALARFYAAKLLLAHSIGSQPAYGASEEVEQRLGETIAKHNLIDTAATFDWEAVVIEGDAVTEVTRVAAEQRVDLIVLSSRRNPGVAAVLDPTAEAISRTAPCPVLITHRQEQEPALRLREETGFQRILVAYDFSGDSELALTYGLSLAQEFQSELHLIHVLPPSSTARKTEEALASSNPESTFHAAARRLHHAVPAETHLWSKVKQVVSQGLPYREILAYARENDMDLICIGASGAGFGQWALFGSNTDRILRQAACPVFIARPLKPAGNRTVMAVNREAAS